MLALASLIHGGKNVSPCESEGYAVCTSRRDDGLPSYINKKDFRARTVWQGRRREAPAWLIALPTKGRLETNVIEFGRDLKIKKHPM